MIIGSKFRFSKEWQSNILHYRIKLNLGIISNSTLKLIKARAFLGFSVV